MQDCCHAAQLAWQPLRNMMACQISSLPPVCCHWGLGFTFLWHISPRHTLMLGSMAATCMFFCRDKWLFTPRVKPAQQAHMPEAANPSEIFGDPFKWEPQPVAPYTFEMQDGVFRVYDGSKEPFPVPGNSYDFFSDMSRSPFC